MIDTRGLPATIKWMENELTALKIAHERGLGLVNYYYTERTITLPASEIGGAGLTITAKALDGEVVPILAQLATSDTKIFSLTASIFSISVSARGDSIEWTAVVSYDENSTPSLTVGLFSSCACDLEVEAHAY